MQRTFLRTIFFLVGVLLLTTACQPIRPESAMAADADAEEQQFLAAAMGLEEAYQQADLARTISFYADDAVSQPPGYRTDLGKDAIAASYQAFFDAYKMKRDFKLADIKIEGDTATRFGEWSQVLTPKAGGETITEVGRCVVGFKKVNGEWKVAWEIWNTYDSPPQ